MFQNDGRFFHLLEDSQDVELPKLFTFPFYYDPHPLSILAANEVQAYLESQTDFEHNFGLDTSKSGFVIGKMFGVLVVKNQEGQLGYLAAFSGKLADSNYINGFVPPIYDTLNQEGFYKQGEAILNQKNQKLKELEANSAIQQSQQDLEVAKQTAEEEIARFKQTIKEAKKNRDKKRNEAKQNLSESDYNDLLEQLKKESVYMHFRLKDLKEHWQEKITQLETIIENLLQPIQALKEERKQLSASLQTKIHQQYQFLNANGEVQDLVDLFLPTTMQRPPAGAGECAAPKLFQFAYENQYEPIALAEFWWGASPKSAIRKHLQFYPSCKGKCEPILTHMLQGLHVEPSPLHQNLAKDKELEILYEDDDILLVNKPAELFSVPGKVIEDSVYTRMKSYLPNAEGPLLVHRLDASTSGILLIAKNSHSHKKLQRQFLKRTIQKRYVALLDGVLEQKQGEIELPLRVDYNDRPRQLVCYDSGKPAKTRYEVIELKNGKTKVYFYPITGRTHQLRVHSAHQFGLNTPIVGDDLYGKKANRLHLHAEQLIFGHPTLKKRIEIYCPSPF